MASGRSLAPRLRRLRIYLQASRSFGCGWSTASYVFTACDLDADSELRSWSAHSPPLGLKLHEWLYAGRGEEPRSDWRRAVAAVRERRVAEAGPPKA